MDAARFDASARELSRRHIVKGVAGLVIGSSAARAWGGRMRGPSPSSSMPCCLVAAIPRNPRRKFPFLARTSSVRRMPRKLPLSPPPAWSGNGLRPGGWAV